MSQSAMMIISMRTLQRIGASLLAPATLALLMDNYQGEQLTVIQFIVSLYIPRLTARFSNTSVLISGVVVDTLGFVLRNVIGINSGY